MILQMAIKDYKARMAGEERPVTEKVEVRVHDHKGKCYCPYCDIEVKIGARFCDACQSDLEEEH